MEIQQLKKRSQWHFGHAVASGSSERMTCTTFAMGLPEASPSQPHRDSIEHPDPTTPSSHASLQSHREKARAASVRELL